MRQRRDVDNMIEELKVIYIECDKTAHEKLERQKRYMIDVRGGIMNFPSKEEVTRNFHKLKLLQITVIRNYHCSYGH